MSRTANNESAGPAVELRAFTVRYGSFIAVDGATFDMPRGACGLLGKNGAGKSSILKAVLGLVPAAGGKASVLGFDTGHQGRELRDHVGYMPEKEAEFPGLTGLESVILAGRLSGLPHRVAKSRAHEVLYLVGLGEPRYRNVATYSMGMKQRVKLACALVHDPDLLFLDEPTNGLDPEGRKEVLTLLADLASKKGMSLILSSHILSDVEALCEHVVLIDGGKVIRQGPMSELTRAVGRPYRLRVRGTQAAVGGLEQRLEQMGLLRRVLEAGDFELLLAADQPATTVFQLALAESVQVRVLQPLRRSLADVFLDAVNEPPAADVLPALAGGRS